MFCSPFRNGYSFPSTVQERRIQDASGVTVVVLAKIFSIDKGLAAGLAAGGMTQSAIIGVAGDALSKLGLDDNTLKTMQANVAIGYAVTYVFGSFGE